MGAKPQQRRLSVHLMPTCVTPPVFDFPPSLNPELDIGQVEGGFVMGLGYHLTEKMKFDPQSGVALTAGTWVS